MPTTANWILLYIYLLGFSASFVFAVITATPFNYENYKKDISQLPGRSYEEPIFFSDWIMTIIYRITVGYSLFAIFWPITLYCSIKYFIDYERKYPSKTHETESPKAEKEKLPFFFPKKKLSKTHE